MLCPVGMDEWIIGSYWMGNGDNPNKNQSLFNKTGAEDKNRDVRKGKFVINFFIGLKGGEKKKMKKKFSSAIAATLVLSTVIPASFASASFSDIDGSYAKDAIIELQTKGILNGIDATHFDPQGTLTREQFATIVVKSLGLTANATVSSFSDVSGWSVPFVEAAYKAGIIAGVGGGKFDPTATVTREQAATILVKALKTKGTLDESATLNFTDAASISDWAKPFIATAAKYGLVKGNTDGTFNPLGAANREMAAAMAKNFLVSVEAELAKQAMISVVSVEAPNLKQVVVKFNKEVDSNSISGIVITPFGSAVGGGAQSTALSDDKKTVTVATTSALSQDGYYGIDVQGVKDLEGNQITPYSTTIKVSDKVAPSVVSVDGKTKDSTTYTFKMKFSEPVQLDLVKVGDVVAGATSADGITYTVTLPQSTNALEAGKSYNVTINGLRDYAGNFVATANTTVAIVRDDVKPTFSLNAVSEKEFNVVFDKEMSATVPVDGVVVKDKNGTILYQNGVAVLQSDKKTYHVTLLSSPVSSTDTSAELTVEVKGLQDYLGNVVATTTAKVTVAKETVKPVMLGVRLLPGSSTQLEVTFSEKVTNIAPTDFRLTDSKGAEITGAVTTVSNAISDTNNKVVLTLAVGALSKTDAYTLAIVVGSVADMSGNTNDGKAIFFSYTGVSPAAVLANITATTDGTTPTDSTAPNRKVAILFDKTDVVNGIDPATGNYKDGAADNSANYTIDGAALPKGAKATFVDGGASNDSVILDLSLVADADLPVSFKQGGNAVVTVSNIKTTAGAQVQYTSKQIAVVDKTAPTIQAAYLSGDATAGYKLTLQMSEQVTGSAAGDFMLTSTTATFNLANAVVDATNKTKIVVDVTIATGTIVGATVTLGTAATPATADLATPANPLAGSQSGIAVVNYAQ